MKMWDDSLFSKREDCADLLPADTQGNSKGSPLIHISLAPEVEDCLQYFYAIVTKGMNSWSEATYPR